VLLALTGYQALQARDALEVVAAEFEDIAEQLKTGDEAGARRSLDTAQTAAADARSSTTGLGWWLTSQLPGVGDDVYAVRTVADVTDVLASEVLPEVVAASETLNPARLRPNGGKVMLAPLRAVAPEVVQANQAMQRQEQRIRALDSGDLNPQLAAPVELMQDKLGEAAALSAKAAYAVQLLPPMLGAEGPRSYLALFQNNAEIRATGGIPGAFATIDADGGQVSLGQQGDAGSIGRFEDPVLPLTGEEIGIYEEKLGLFPQNVNFTPDFPRSAELAQAMWQHTTGKTVDGVVSVDPVALSYLLEGTGPVTLPTGESLTADNAVNVLLHQIYLREPDPAVQDAFFALAAQAVFDALAAGKGEPTAVLDGLARAAEEGRLLVWSAHPAEQSMLSETRLGGRIPREPDDRPFVGVFFNDGTAAKMQYFYDYSVDVEPVTCNVAGRQTLEVTVTMTSTAPSDAGSLPDYITGGGAALRPGSMRVNAHLYAPLGGWIDASAVDGVEHPMNIQEHLGRAVGSRTVELAPGETHELTYTVMTGLDQPGDVRLRVTPGVHGTGVGDVAPSACSIS
jgi:hypothetical protein